MAEKNLCRNRGLTKTNRSMRKLVMEYKLFKSRSHFEFPGTKKSALFFFLLRNDEIFFES